MSERTKTYGFVAVTEDPDPGVGEVYLEIFRGDEDWSWHTTQHLTNAEIYPIVSDLRADLEKYNRDYTIRPVKIQIID